MNFSEPDAVEALARDALSKHVVIGGPARVNRDLIRDMAGLGLFAPFFSKGVGGTGDGSISATVLCAVREGLARVSTEASTAFATQIGGIFVALRHALPEARQEWVPKVVSGEAVSAVCLTEPELGSDLASMAMPAEKADGGWSLSGTKTWIMKAPDADIYTVFARTSGSGAKGITAFLVPRSSPGLTGEAIDALWPDRVGNMHFDKVFVPDSHVIGPVGEGFKIGMGIFDAFRPSVGAHSVGLAEAALRASVAYAKERKAFGQPIGGFQAVSHLLAEMATQLQAARLLVYDAARAYDEADRRRLGPASSMAKLFASQAGQFVVDAAVQIHGAAGLQRGHLVEHLYREVRPARIYEGTDQIQREIIARGLLAERRGN
ncbi:MAG: acyl-CoA dehydrogenase family protein [Rhodobiaceae bacterium]|nr:acyl-CoA dehydrogenase family protein [Rhodobiaceae bacterium]MCC0056161.1 acyl-CoA dehydrogenase family protein [Rhodobiaceae bacterium]